MTKREKEKLALIEQFRQYFNECRNAGISTIEDVESCVVVRYYDKRKVVIDALSYVGLFDKLNEMHPRTSPPQ